MHLLLGLHHTGGQEVVEVKKGAVLVLHVVLEPSFIAILKYYHTVTLVSMTGQPRNSPCR